MNIPIIPSIIALLPIFASSLIAAENYNKSFVSEESFIVKEIPEKIDAGNYLGNERIVWRGERINIPVILETGANIKAVLVNKQKKAIPVSVNLVRNVIAKDGKAFPDIIEPNKNFVQPGEKQIYWLSVDIPSSTKMGNYQILLNDEKIADIRVIAATLPKPQGWSVHLDLWQHPEAVARWVGVPLWSEEHFKAMEPLMRRLADAGQKTITCSIIEEPWQHQTWDNWTSMIKWTKKKDGKWSFDYTAFDKWVSFMFSIGIDQQISCYSMISWQNSTQYFNEATGKKEKININPEKPEAQIIWGEFLTDFRNHLKAKGWLEKTAIALDERPDKVVRATCDLVKRYAPEMRIVSAVDKPSKMDPFVDDISPVFHHSGGDVPALAKARKARGKVTTFYVCCNPAKPNTFAHSAAAESHWLGLYAAANNFDGFLRWAYNSWTENPFKNTKHRARGWLPTDCFVVYPGNRSTMRFERLRDGLEDFEKIQILRNRATQANASPKLKAAVENLEKYLVETFTVKNGGGNAHAEQVKQARSLIDAASLYLVK